MADDRKRRAVREYAASQSAQARDVRITFPETFRSRVSVRVTFPDGQEFAIQHPVMNVAAELRRIADMVERDWLGQ